MLVSREELGWLANGVVSFANSPRGVVQGRDAAAAGRRARGGGARRLGDQSDALFYVNVKGAVATPGKHRGQRGRRRC